MIVRLRSIHPVNGLAVEMNIPAKDWMLEPKADEHFEKDAKCNLHLEIAEKDVFIKGTCATDGECTCYRCGEKFNYFINLNLSLTCLPKIPAHAQGGQTAQDSDEGVVFYEKEELDLTAIVREQMLLSLPMRYLCSQDCSGPQK